MSHLKTLTKLYKPRAYERQFAVFRASVIFRLSYFDLFDRGREYCLLVRGVDSWTWV